MTDRKFKKQGDWKPKVGNPLFLAEFVNAEIKSSHCNVLKFQSYKSHELNSLCRHKKFLVASNQRLQYVGSNYEHETFKIISSVLKVAVFKKATGKMKLYDVDLFHAKPLLKCYPSIKGETEGTFREKSDALALEFGSKNKAKAIASKQWNETAGNESFNISSIPQSCIWDKKLDVNAKQKPEAIPSSNKNAVSVDEVYDIYEIISQEEYSALESEADVLFSATYTDIQLWKTNDRYCKFVIQCLEARFKNLTLHDAKLLCYFNYLMCFLKTSYWRKKDPVPEVPEPFRKSLMNRYVLQRSMPQRMKDKLLAEAIILALTINNYVIDGKVLAASSLISMQRIVLIAYTLGCHVSERKNQDMKLIQLKLPLYKYEPRTFKRK